MHKTPSMDREVSDRSQPVPQRTSTEGLSNREDYLFNKLLQGNKSSLDFILSTHQWLAVTERYHNYDSEIDTKDIDSKINSIFKSLVSKFKCVISKLESKQGCDDSNSEIEIEDFGVISEVNFINEFKFLDFKLEYEIRKLEYKWSSDNGNFKSIIEDLYSEIGKVFFNLVNILISKRSGDDGNSKIDTKNQDSKVIYIFKFLVCLFKYVISKLESNQSCDDSNSRINIKNIDDIVIDVMNGLIYGFRYLILYLKCKMSYNDDSIFENKFTDFELINLFESLLNVFEFKQSSDCRTYPSCDLGDSVMQN